MRKLENPEKNFWDNFKKNHNGCLEWQKSLDRGYGQYWYLGKMYKCHRLAWILKKGNISKGLFVCHRCNNPKCSNIEHLYLGTQKDNMWDYSAKIWKLNPKYPKSKRIKPTDVEVIKKSNKSAKELAVEYRLSENYIFQLRSGRRTVTNDYHWKPKRIKHG